jgi:hypothetical protein
MGTSFNRGRQRRLGTTWNSAQGDGGHIDQGIEKNRIVGGPDVGARRLGTARIFAECHIAAVTVASFVARTIGIGRALSGRVRIAVVAHFQFRKASIAVDQDFVVLAHSSTEVVSDSAISHVVFAACTLAVFANANVALALVVDFAVIAPIAFWITDAVAVDLIAAASDRAAQVLLESATDWETDARVSVVRTILRASNFAGLVWNRHTAGGVRMRKTIRALELGNRAAMTNGSLGEVGFAACHDAELIGAAVVFEQAGTRKRQEGVRQARNAFPSRNLALDDFAVCADRIADWTPAMCALADVLLRIGSETIDTTAHAVDALTEGRRTSILALALVSDLSDFLANGSILDFIKRASTPAFATVKNFVRLAFEGTHAVFDLGRRTTLAGLHTGYRRAGARKWLLADGSAWLILVRSRLTNQMPNGRSEPLHLSHVSFIAGTQSRFAPDRVRAAAAVAFRIVLAFFADVFQRAIVIAPVNVRRDQRNQQSDQELHC